MFWIIVSAIAVALLSFWFGYAHRIYLDHITARRLSYFLIAVALLFLILQILHRNGLFPEAIAGAFMACVYSLIFGLFLGSAIQQYLQKTKSGKILYVNRTFISDFFPNIAAIALILFGLYRTSLLIPDVPVTPIRITSGLSLIAVGFYVFTIRPVPEFRKDGLILLDRKISWEHFIAYSWFSERVIEIEYERDEAFRSFKTMIPDEDQLTIEKIMNDKMKEKLEEVE